MKFKEIIKFSLITEENEKIKALKKSIKDLEWLNNHMRLNKLSVNNRIMQGGETAKSAQNMKKSISNKIKANNEKIKKIREQIKSIREEEKTKKEKNG